MNKPTVETLRLRLTAAEFRLRWSSLSGFDPVAEVAVMLSTSHDILHWHLYAPGHPRYRSFVVRKRRDGFRTLAEPVKGLKALQQKLLEILSEVYQPKPWVTGFVVGQSIRTNAEIHTGAKAVLNIDIKDFFPSINFGRVRGMLIAWPYRLPPNTASVLAQLCCFRGSLPQGAPTSPIIANMVCARLDSELRKLAADHRCRYSRYADDITFSTQAKSFSPALARDGGSPSSIEVGEKLAAVISGNGFTINHKKVRLRHRTGRLEVTGLTINEFPNVPRSYVREIRAMLHSWQRDGLEKATARFVQKYDRKNRGPYKPVVDFKSVVRGKLDFLRMVRGSSNSIYQALAQKYADQDNSYVIPVPVRPTDAISARVKNAIWVVQGFRGDGLGIPEAQGTAFVLKNFGLVTCAHVIRSDDPSVVFCAFQADAPNARYALSLVRMDRDLDVALLHFATGTAPFGFRVADHPIEPPRGGFLLPAHQMLATQTSVTAYGFANYSEEREPTIRPLLVVGSRVHMGYPRAVVDQGRIISGMSGGPLVAANGRVVGIGATGYENENAAAEGARDPSVIPMTIVSEWLSSPP